MLQPLSHAAAAWPSGAMGYAPALSSRRYYTLAEWAQLHGKGVAGLGDLGDLGAGTVGETIAVSAPAIAGSALIAGITAAGTPAAIAAGGTGTFLAMGSAFIPVVGVVIAGVTLALMAIFARKGPKQKVATTEIVNKIAPLWEKNLAGYMSGPHTVSSQAQALANFDAGWQYILDNCGIPAMGDPGKRCISERDRGGIYDGFAAWRDPIANDPHVVPDPVVDEVGNLIDSVTGGVFTSATGGGTGWLLLAGLAIAGVFMLGGSKR